MAAPLRQVNFLLEIAKTVSALLYGAKPSESGTPIMNLVDIDVFGGFSPCDFDETLANISKFFPGGAVSCRIHTNSTYTIREAQGLRIFLDNFDVLPPPNEAIRRRFALPWYGNVLIMKYTTTSQIEQMPPTSLLLDELDSVHRIVEEWLTTQVNFGIFDPRGLRSTPLAPDTSTYELSLKDIYGAAAARGIFQQLLYGPRAGCVPRSEKRSGTWISFRRALFFCPRSLSSGWVKFTLVIP
ncbi:hypothetical protein BKA70DRAFT_1240984 [Coprinopsis sp. MPI-PUGE-AT-0042]|nr:hypothetical protein BKA70DRAFT_1240984 [Coprinopsis sp. MPI-PUGE-AT-0042]